MTDTTPRFALPLLIPGQAQKELYHNESLLALDIALHAAVEGDPLADPPDSPARGSSWIVGTAATGNWTGEDGKLACWTDGGWRFVAPIAGMAVWNTSAGYWIRYDGTAWNDGALSVAVLTIGGQQVVGARQPAIASPSGGTTIDTEARAAIDALIATLISHGLTD